MCHVFWEPEINDLKKKKISALTPIYKGQCSASELQCFIHQGSSRFRKQTWCCKAIISENITCTDVESRCRLFQVVLPPGASGEIREVFQGILSFDLGKTPRTPCVWMTQAIHALHIIYKYARQTQISEKTKHHPVFDSQTKYIYI